MSEEMTRKEVIWQLKGLLLGELRTTTKERKALEYAISSLETDETYQLEYERTTKNDLAVDFKLKDYVSREAVRRIIKSPRTQEQMLNALNSLRNITECKAEDCINRDYTAKYVEEFANNEYVSQDEAETIYLIADGIRHIPSALPDVHDNNVGNIDCISRAQAQTKIEMNASRYSIAKERGGMGQVEWSDQLIKVSDAVNIIRELPSVTPQEPQSFKWCTDCKEYDQEKHCCHRYSKVIRDTVEEMKQEYIEREVLDKIRVEIMTCLKALDDIEKSGLNIYLPNEMSGRRLTYQQCIGFIDKYKAESEPQESEDKKNG